MLGIVVAMEREARIVRGAVARVGMQDAIQVGVTGIGPRRARAGARAMLGQGVWGIAVVGFAGALVDGIAAGDLLLPGAVCSPGGEILACGWNPVPAGRWPCAPRGMHTGLLASVPRVAADSATKRALALSTGAVAVDMESASVAAVAQAAGVPWTVLRAVSDDARRTLPGFALGAVDGYGRVRGAAFAAGLVRRPWELPGLLASGRDLARASRALRAALDVALPAWCAHVPGTIR